MSTATADTTAVIHAHVHAIVEMLLQKRRLKQGVAITAGDPLDAARLMISPAQLLVRRPTSSTCNSPRQAPAISV